MRRAFISLIVVALLLPAVSPGQEKQDKSEKVMALSLEDAIIRTLKNNYGVAIQVLNPEVASLSVTKAREIFYPTLTLDYSSRSTKNASYSFLDASESVITNFYSYDAGLSQLLPTGGTLTASVTNYRNKSNSNFQTIHNASRTIFGLIFDCPDRRSSNVIGTSTTWNPRIHASLVISIWNEYPLDLIRSRSMDSSTARR